MNCLLERPLSLKISCILTSYNRPTFVRNSLKSIQDQTYQNYQLIVIDNSTEMYIKPVIKEFCFAEVQLKLMSWTEDQIAKTNILAIHMNIGLSMANGDLVCFLCDDDYYFPTWFEKAARFFESNEDKSVGFGKLVYSTSRDMIFPDNPIRYPEEVLTRPWGNVDHNQVIHRNFKHAFKVPEYYQFYKGPDAPYFDQIADRHKFYPIDTYAVVKRDHSKSLTNNWDNYFKPNQVRE